MKLLEDLREQVLAQRDEAPVERGATPPAAAHAQSAELLGQTAEAPPTAAAARPPS